MHKIFKLYIYVDFLLVAIHYFVRLSYENKKHSVFSLPKYIVQLQCCNADKITHICNDKCVRLESLSSLLYCWDSIYLVWHVVLWRHSAVHSFGHWCCSVTLHHPFIRSLMLFFYPSSGGDHRPGALLTLSRDLGERQGYRSAGIHEARPKTLGVRGDDQALWGPRGGNHERARILQRRTHCVVHRWNLGLSLCKKNVHGHNSDKIFCCSYSSRLSNIAFCRGLCHHRIFVHTIQTLILGFLSSAWHSLFN